MEKIWFLYSSIDKKVSGPFVSDDVHRKLSAGEITPDCNIWWKGQREWLSVHTWISSGEKLLKSQKEKSNSAIWYLDLGGEPTGPLTQSEMIDSLRGHQNFNRIRLWTVGMKTWKSIFEFSEVMDALGVSRREHTRAPLIANVQLNRAGDSEISIVLKAATLSIAGVGLNNANSLIKGEELQIMIKSDEFSAPIRARVIVIYVSSNGNAGLKFQQLQPESQSIIYDYIRKFTTSDEAPQKAVA